MEIRPLSIPNIREASVHDLYQLAQNDGRFGFSEKEGLYVRASGPLERAMRQLSDLTSKRQNTYLAVKAICKRNNMNFVEALMATGLTGKELDDVVHGKVDLTTERVNEALSRCVQINKTWFVIEGELGKGGYGSVHVARHKQVRVALKQSDQDLTRESDLLEVSAQTLDHSDSHVIATYGKATGLDKDTQYLIMDLATGDAENAVDTQRRLRPVQEEFGSRGRQPKEGVHGSSRSTLTQKVLIASAKKPDVILTVRDWIDGLGQIAAKGIAHRDIKPGNFLLIDGKWVLTDFGTSGDEHDLFSPRPGIRPFELTGNANTYAKSPEWLKSEDDAKATGLAFRVGCKDDVFSLGVAAYRLLTGSRFPFDGLPQQPDVAIAPFTYVDNVNEYVTSGKLFSQWHEGHTGHPIPAAWRSFLDGALDSDPAQRLTAIQLRGLELFQNANLDLPKVRTAISKHFKH